MDKTQKSALGFVGRMILGPNNPGPIRKLMFWVGLAGSLYFFTWFSFMYVAVTNLDSVSGTGKLRALLQSLGEKYEIQDMIVSVENYSLFGAGLFIASLVFLVLIWRRVRIAFLLYAMVFLFAAAAGIFFLNMDGFMKEVTWFDQTLYVAYFGVFMAFHFLQGKTDTQKMEKQMQKVVQKAVKNA